MNKQPKNILVIRNDKLGDFMLAYPAFSLLKKSISDCEITALVPAYTKAAAEICPWIDNVIVEDEHTSFSEHKKLAGILQAYNFDAAIVLFSTMSTAITTRLAKIPYRLAPATKWAQFLYNQRLKQRRSRSEKPEYEYNKDLIYYFLQQHKIKPAENIEPPFLSFDQEEVDKYKRAFIEKYKIPAEQAIIFVHPGSGGSANNLSFNQYAKLINGITSRSGHHIVLTAGPGEEKLAKEVSKSITVPHSIYCSTEGLLSFMKHQAFCDCFISGSTGTLHTAGALNCKTVSFYPRKRSSTPLRWQTCNEDSKRMSFMPPETAEESDMSSINVEMVAKKISAFL